MILSSHLGRPKGGYEAKFSLASVIPRLSELMGKPVKLISDCIGAPAAEGIAAMKDGDVVLLENVRFYPEEEANEAGNPPHLFLLISLLFYRTPGSKHA